MFSLVDKVKGFVLLNRMIEPGDKILVAVSGGADSVALLHCLVLLKDELRFSLSIAHLNHLTRGKESDADAEFVSRLGELLHVETFLDSLDAKQESAKLKTSFQEGARILRYRFFESALKKWGGNKIAVGHNADDSVETVLINFFRGSGMKGLSGIPPVRGEIIRPMLCCYRAEIVGFLDKRQLPCRHDATNAEKNYLRNKIRLDLIPRLESEYSRNIKSHILNMAGILREEDDCLESLQSLNALPLKNGESCILRQEEVRSLHPALQRRVIRRAMTCVLGSLRQITLRHVDDVIKLMQAPGPGKEIHLPGFLVVLCKDSELVFSIKPNPSSGILDTSDFLVAESIELKIPGVTEVPAAFLKLCAQILPGGEYKPVSAEKSCFDFEKTGERIQVRFFRPGDRFVPLGMTGSQKLKSFFIDKKVPRDKRKRIPVLTTQHGDIIWVYGMRIAHGYRVTLETKQVLCIEGLRDT